jgi:hypothetical protein
VPDTNDVDSIIHDDALLSVTSISMGLEPFCADSLGLNLVDVLEGCSLQLHRAVLQDAKIMTPIRYVINYLKNLIATRSRALNNKVSSCHNS